MFIPMFSQDVGVLKSQCLRIIGVLIEYDNKFEAELLPTLRAVVDNCCNWKLSAESRFIHVNTLHYRVAKIEQLLDVSLSRMDVRVNLFMAIKAWDTLEKLGFLDKLPLRDDQECQLIHERVSKDKIKAI
jgi:DNA-binding PucR family transcriptional regulator